MGDSGLLRTFAELAGGSSARIVLVTTASATPDAAFAEYSAAFSRLGVREIRELGLARQEQAKGEQTLTVLARATGVFFTGGDQSRLAALVGSKTNQILRRRLAGSMLLIAGTSAGATALGTTMIKGRDARGRLRTGPGLGLAPGVIVDMHFAERQRLPRLIAAVLRQPAQLGIGIDEDTAILIRSRRFDVLGRGAVVTVDARRPGVHLHQLHAGDAFDMARRRPISSSGSEPREDE